MVTEDWFFATHFLPMARAARKSGFEVVVVTRVGEKANDLRSEGFRLIDLSADRSSFGLIGLFSSIVRLRSIMAHERPAVVHAIALRSVVIAGAATLMQRGTAVVFSLTGLGYLWSGNRLPLRLARTAIRLMLSVFSKRTAAIFTFENEDDASEFPSLQRKLVIGGWGVDPAALQVKESVGPSSSVNVLYLGRMLKAKGIESAVEAIQIARRKEDVHLELWGMPDPGNLTSLTEAQLNGFSSLDGVQWHGRAMDISSTWHRADIAILLSEREGMPRTLIEAAAAGLPMIAYDVAGCRSIVQDGINGFLIPPGDVHEVADAVVRLAQDWQLRRRMGSAARADFERRFSTGSVVPRIIELYLNLVRSPNMS